MLEKIKMFFVKLKENEALIGRWTILIVALILLLGICYGISKIFSIF